MTDDDRHAGRVTAAQLGGVALLERAICYTLGSLHLVTPAALPAPTPCRGWDLRTLLAHLDDSLAALQEAADTGRIDPATGAAPGLADRDPTAGLRNRACLLLGAWAAAEHRDLIALGDAPLTSGIVTSAGAVEIAVHGWDVARACGRDRPIPAALAEAMLDLAPLFVTGADRPGRFGRPLDLSLPGCPGDRLVAFLGRRP